MAEVESPSDAVLRVTRFGGGMSRHPVDAAAREALPRLLAEAGNVGAWFGRRLTENGEERAIVTIWRSAADEAASRRLLDIIGPDAIATGMVDQPVVREVLPVSFHLRVQRTVAPGVLRIYDGRVVASRLDAYVALARSASIADAERAQGPMTVCMALDRPDRLAPEPVARGERAVHVREDALHLGQIRLAQRARPLLTPHVTPRVASRPWKFSRVVRSSGPVRLASGTLRARRRKVSMFGSRP